MPHDLEPAQAGQVQRIWALLAGCLFLAVIVIAFAGGSLLSHIAGSGTFAETAARIARSPHLYRSALSLALLVTLGSVLLAFSLYATLKPVQSLLAQLAMIFSLADSVLGLLVRMSDFVRAHLYISAQTSATATAAAQPLSDLLRTIADTTENIGGILFGIGSLLFFYLFFRSRYISRLIGTLGLAASVLFTGVYFVSMIFPEHRHLLQIICFPPMGVADVSTGVCLIRFATQTKLRRH